MPVKFTEWDRCELFIAKRNMGKTGLATGRMMRYQEEFSAYIIAHDVARRIHGVAYPGGVEVPVHRHETLEEMATAINIDPLGIHTVRCYDVDDMLRWGMDELAPAALAAHGGDEGDPVVLWINEVSAAPSAGVQRAGIGRRGERPNPRADDPLRWLCTQGRHEHCALCVEAQSSRMLTWELMTAATAITMGRLQDDAACDRLVEFGVPQELVDLLPVMPKYEYVRFETTGEGVTETSERYTEWLGFGAD